MNAIKKYFGIIWLLLAIAVAYYSFEIFGPKLSSGKQEDTVFGIILFGILMPMIVVGLAIFGYFCLTNEYKK